MGDLKPKHFQGEIVFPLFGVNAITIVNCSRTRDSMEMEQLSERREQ